MEVEFAGVLDGIEQRERGSYYFNIGDKWHYVGAMEGALFRQVQIGDSLSKNAGEPYFKLFTQDGKELIIRY